MPHAHSFPAPRTRHLFAAGVTAALLATSAPAHAQGRSLEGTWLVQVRLLTSCSGGSALAPFWSILTFAQGGTLSGTTSNPAFAPGQRSADHGTWAAASGGSTYTAASVAFINVSTAPTPPVSPGFEAGAQRIDQTIAVTSPTTFTSDASVIFIDDNLQRYRAGCATAVGRRFE